MGSNDLMMRWPEADPRGLPLFREAGVAAVWLPLAAPGDRGAFLQACRQAAIRVIAEVGGEISSGLAEARQAGFDGAACAASHEERQVRELAAQYRGWALFVYLKPDQAHWRIEPARAVLLAGLWPGSRRTGASVASATQAVWLDANSYWVACLRGLFPDREALLGYRPDEEAGVAKDQRVPYSSVELSLAEAVVAGGSVVLTLPEHYRTALLDGEARAQAAWKSLVETATFLRENAATFRQPLATRVVVAAGALEDCAEILNLLYRHSVSAAVTPAGAVPPYGQYRILVAVGLGRHPAGARAALEFARAGGKVLVAPAAAGEAAWWLEAGARKTGSEEERDFFQLGRGLLITYREPVADPGEFALDVIDALGWRTRDLRLWGANAIIGILHRQTGGRLSVELINYGGAGRDYLLRVEGPFSKATLRAPGAAPRLLRAAYRGSGTEVEMSAGNRVASLLLE